MKIVPIVYGDSFLSENLVFLGGDKNKMHPIKFILYFLEDGGRRILIDAGCDTMPGFDMRNFIGPVAALERAGISPSDITDVIITHAHHDHIEGVRHFASATVHIQKDEYAQGAEYLRGNPHINTFDSEYSLTDNVTVIKIGGHSMGSCIVDIKSGGARYIAVGDECYARECLTRIIPTGASCDPDRSLAFVKKYSSAEFTPLLAHEL